MKEAEIWRKCYELAMIETDEDDCLFIKDLLSFLSSNIDKDVHPKKVKEIFVDCYNLLDSQLKETKWTAVPEVSNDLIHEKHGNDKEEQALCSELLAVVVNHIGRKAS